MGFIELLFILPLILMIVTFAFESGFIMYDFSTINYTASSMAIEAARNGSFDNEIASRGGDYLKGFTSQGAESGILRSNSFYIDPANIVIWGPAENQSFQRGELITVGICYPIKFKLFYMDALAGWLIEEEKLNLKGRASAMSEVYFEP